MPSTSFLGRDGNFYGVTADGGAHHAGTVYQLTPAGKFTTLHTFSALDTTNHNIDGAGPSAPLIQDASGNFYSTTHYGSANGYGTVFKVTPAGVVITLHDFAGGNGDGANTRSGLRTAVSTGRPPTAVPNAAGTVYRVTLAGDFTLLHGFSARNDNGDNTDGSSPRAGLVQDAQRQFLRHDRVRRQPVA